MGRSGGLRGKMEPLGDGGLQLMFEMAYDHGKGILNVSVYWNLEFHEEEMAQVVTMVV